MPKIAAYGTALLMTGNNLTINPTSIRTHSFSPKISRR